MDNPSNFFSIFKNIALNLRATGPAAVMCVWVLSVAALGIFGGAHADQALLVLEIFGLTVLGSLATRPT